MRTEIFGLMKAGCRLVFFRILPILCNLGPCYQVRLASRILAKFMVICPKLLYLQYMIWRVLADNPLLRQNRFKNSIYWKYWLEKMESDTMS